jgi:CRP-like cAMP-binding protein
LLKAEILGGLEPAVKRSFLNDCAVRIYKKPTIILEQGMPADGMVIIAHGYIDVTYTGENGNQMFLVRAKSGATLGDTETISEEPCAATCTTSPNTTVLFCSPAHISTALQNPKFIKNITKILHRRLVYDNWVKHIGQFGDVGERLCGYLYVLSENVGVISETQSYLANVVGCSRQTINRELAALRAAGIIAQNGSEITVLDRAALGTGLIE